MGSGRDDKKCLEYIKIREYYDLAREYRRYHVTGNEPTQAMCRFRKGQQEESIPKLLYHVYSRMKVLKGTIDGKLYDKVFCDKSFRMTEYIWLRTLRGNKI